MGAHLFISYSHSDESWLERLHKHLAHLERDGTVSGWYDREIHAGARLDDAIQQQLEQADIFLACASPDYIASHYCYDRELDFALAQEKAGRLFIVPVILEPCEWLETSLGKFKATPTDGKPVAEFTNPNVALLDVATDLRRLCSKVRSPVEFKSSSATTTSINADTSRYRVKRQFDKLHKRDFVDQAFSVIYSFFESSSNELQLIPNVEARITRSGDDRFSCTVINRGLQRGFETLHVRKGGSWGAIDVLFGEKDETHTSNGASLLGQMIIKCISLPQCSLFPPKKKI